MEELGTLSDLHRSHTSKATAAAEVQEEKGDKLVIKFLHTEGDFGNYWSFFLLVILCLYHLASIPILSGRYIASNCL